MKKNYAPLDLEEVKRVYAETQNLHKTAKILGFGRSKIQEFCAKHGIKRETVYNHDAFAEINENSCYWAGFIAADGCIYRQQIKIALQLCDRQHLTNLYEYVGNPIKAKIRRGYARFGIRSKKMTEDLYKNFNITPKKSLTLQPPNIKDDNLIRHYLRGFIDGDGHLYITTDNTLRLSITSGSEKMTIWIKNIFNRKFNCNARIWSKTHKDTGNTYHTVMVTRSQAVENILTWLYKNSDTKFCLKRKFEKYEEMMAIRIRLREKKEKIKWQVTEMKRLYRDGYIYREIAEKLGIKYSKVFTYLSQATDIKIYRGPRKHLRNP